MAITEKSNEMTNMESESKKKKKQVQEDSDDVPGLIQMVQAGFKLADDVKKAKEGASITQKNALKAKVAAMKEEVAARKELVDLTKEERELALELAKARLLQVGSSKNYQFLAYRALLKKARAERAEVFISSNGSLTLLHYNDKKGERWYKGVPLALGRHRLTAITKEEYEQLKRDIEKV